MEETGLSVNVIDKIESKTSSCKEVCHKCDMKLRDAEKTIANKDVIIKMLRVHVKHLEEACKQNLRETEDFRYKFCLANEQIKRLRACPKQIENCDRRISEEKEVLALKCELDDWKQQYKQLLALKESELRAPDNSALENCVKENNKLLQSLVQKLSDRQVDKREQIAQLEQEMDRLKNENMRLSEKLSDLECQSFSSVRDSILTHHERGGTKSQERLPVKTDDFLEQLEYQIDLLPHNELHVKIIPPPEINVADSISENSKNEHSFLYQEENAAQATLDQPVDSSTEDPPELTESGVQKKEAMASQSADTTQNVDVFLKETVKIREQHTDVLQELELLKRETENSRSSVQNYIQEALKELNAQKEIVLSNLKANQVVLDHLVEVTDKIHYDLQGMKGKIQFLSEYKGGQHSPIDSSDHDVITLEECKHHISDMVVGSASSVQEIHPTTDLEQEYTNLKKWEQKKDQQLDSINKLTECYKRLSEGVTAIRQNNKPSDRVLTRKVQLPSKNKTENSDSNSSELQIEDIYNVVVNTYASVTTRPTYSREQFCHEGFYDGICCSLPTCAIRQPSFQSFCDDSCPCSAPEVSQKHSLSNLQNYVDYLHQQLEVISGIETQIKDLRMDMKTSQ